MRTLKYFNQEESMNVSIDAILSSNSNARVQIRQTERGWEMKQLDAPSMTAKLNRALRNIKSALLAQDAF